MNNPIIHILALITLPFAYLFGWRPVDHSAEWSDEDLEKLRGVGSKLENRDDNGQQQRLVQTPTERDKEIQRMCESVLEIDSEYSEDDYEGSSYCLICGHSYRSRNFNKVGMDRIKHDQSCAYLMAGDLLTKQNAQAHTPDEL